ncbi:unnamed protein product [Anisakis simplex]|uniref:Estradiol 17-beta-dehydrogenase 8 (inferred by orthology to a human protein) n=1 Tax=Anisakis simplex TaxID=6269 RepID=A0A0M3KBQ3_ANISI|nr:unnamed protein product [Anisakis simplex]
MARLLTGKFAVVTDGAKHTAFGCDVAQSAEVKSLVDFALKTYNSPPAIVVNNAGIIRDAPILDMTEEQFDEVVAVNLKGVYLVAQAFARAAIQQKTPQSIINMASILGKVGASERANYASTKVNECISSLRPSS